VIVYRVGDPITSLSASSGDGQTAAVGSYFNQLLVVQASTAAKTSGGPANAPVTFTVVAGNAGASGTFSGQSSVTVYANSAGIATAPPLLAVGANGAWQVQATTPGSTTQKTPPSPVTFNLTNSGTPVLPSIQTTITSKTGPSNARIWTLQLRNTGTTGAGQVTLNSLSFSQEAGAACSPLVTSGLPIVIPLLSASASGTGNVTLDFSSCSAAARFSVTPAITVNGVALSPAVIAHQFQ
jgi:hypothetical protein